MVAWGWNGGGQTTIPAGLANVTGIAAGWLHTVAVRANGAVVAWGGNESRQTNVPAGLANAVAVAAGFGHTLVLRDATSGNFMPPPPPVISASPPETVAGKRSMPRGAGPPFFSPTWLYCEP